MTLRKRLDKLEVTHQPIARTYIWNQDDDDPGMFTNTEGQRLTREQIRALDGMQIVVLRSTGVKATLSGE
jgi:hypothetical protein